MLYHTTELRRGLYTSCHGVVFLTRCVALLYAVIILCALGLAVIWSTQQFLVLQLINTTSSPLRCWAETNTIILSLALIYILQWAKMDWIALCYTHPVFDRGH